MLIKAVTIFLVLITLALAQSAVLSNSTDGLVPFTDFTNPEFQKVLDVVRSQQTQVAAWSPSRATKQGLNGVRYSFRLVSNLGEIADVVSFVNPQGVATILSFNIIIGRKRVSQKSLDATGTGFKPFTEYSNSSFQRALEQTKWQNFYLLVLYRLNRTELFVSSRFYYFKFTFTNRLNTSRIIRLIECVSF